MSLKLSSHAHRPLARLGVDLRLGEGAVCSLLFIVHFLLLAFQYASKTMRQASFIDEIGVHKLPLVYLAVPLVAIPLLALHGHLLQRWPQKRLVAFSCLLAAVSYVGFWFWLGHPSPWSSLAFYLWTSVVGLMLVSQFWTYASTRLDPRQAKRLFGFIGAGGILGSIAGGQMAHAASVFFEPRTTLLSASTALLLAALLITLAKGAGLPTSGAPAVETQAKAPGKGDTKHGADQQRGRTRRDGKKVAGTNGWALLRRSKYLRLLAALVLFSSMLAQVVDLQFNWAVEASTHNLSQRVSLIGNFYSLMGLAALLFQILLTARIHRRLGMGFALRLPPLVNAVGSLLFLAAVLAHPLLLLPAVGIMKVGENGLRYSLDQVTRELLFLPLPSSERAVAKAFIDVFVQRAAKGLAALALLAVTFGWLSVPATVVFSALWICLWLLVIGPVRKSYVGSYRDGLRARIDRPEPDLDLTDSATLEILFAGLAAEESRRVLHSLDLLTSHGKAYLVPPHLLHHIAPEVRQGTLRALREAGRGDAIPLVESLLADPNPEVRASATRTLVSLAPADVAQLMRQHLRDPDPRVRTEALSHLVSGENRQDRQLAESLMQEMLDDGDPRIRQQAAKVLGGMRDPRGQAALVRLLYDQDQDVVRQAIGSVHQRALAGAPNPLYVPILVSHLHERYFKRSARQALVAYGRQVIPTLQHFLTDPQEEIWVRRALPKTIAEIGGRGAMDTLLANLAVADLFLRRKVVQALTSLRHKTPELCPVAASMQPAIALETRGYLRILLDLESLQDTKRRPHLLEQLLTGRLQDHLLILFGLLALQLPQGDVRAAFRALRTAQPTARAHALEYLDNVLSGDTRKRVLAVIDDLPPMERRGQAKRLFELVPESRPEVLRRLIHRRPTGDVDAAWLSAAALHYIDDLRLKGLSGEIAEAARKDRDPLVLETVRLLLP